MWFVYIVKWQIRLVAFYKCQTWNQAWNHDFMTKFHVPDNCLLISFIFQKFSLSSFHVLAEIKTNLIWIGHARQCCRFWWFFTNLVIFKIFQWLSEFSYFLYLVNFYVNVLYFSYWSYFQFLIRSKYWTILTFNCITMDC